GLCCARARARSGPSSASRGKCREASHVVRGVLTPHHRTHNDSTEENPMTTTPTTSVDLSQRLLDAPTATLELYAVHIGAELGLYETLDRHGPLTAPALAERAGIDARYAAEWLEQQAVAGFLAVTTPGDRESRTYGLPVEHRGALVDPL